MAQRHQVSDQTLYQQRDEFIEEFADTMVVLSLEGMPVARNSGTPKRANQVLASALLLYR